jgi:hypothetical protein
LERNGGKSAALGDGIAVARTALALANIGLEGVLRTGDTTAIPGALSSFQEAAKLFQEESIAQRRNILARLSFE